MEFNLGSEFYSEEDARYYRVVEGAPNSCDGCVFRAIINNGEDDECNRPDDVGECLAENRSDGIDIVFEEA